MRKIIVAINITRDGFCDHTAGVVDNELHTHYSNVMQNIDISIMGRVTYKLMEDYWPAVAKNKTGTKAEIRFAEELERVDKYVVSNILNEVNWDGVKIISENIIEKIKELREEDGRDILIGGPSLISYLTQSNLIDEFNFLVHPIILGQGIPLFKNLSGQVDLQLLKVKSLASGVISTHYRVKK